MLKKLTIKNFALIEYTEVEFDEKLNILSGETGAGKSIILEALNFSLGAKADRSLIRTGENECFVSIEFDIKDNLNIKKILSDFDIEEDDTLIISRKLSFDGKTSIKVNGNTFTTSMLKNLTRFLVDIHGQSEHFYLLDNKNQLELIDKIGFEKITPIKSKLKSLFDDYNKILTSLNELGGDESNRAIRQDILNYQINEIENAKITENEEEDLLEKKKKILNLQKINDSLSAVYNSISGDDCISDNLYNVNKMLLSISNFSTEYESLYQRLSSILIDLEDVSSTSRNLLDDLSLGDFDINYIENRLDIIKNLKKKYGSNYQEIFLFLQKARQEKEKLDNYEELSKNFLINKNTLENKIYSQYLLLRKERENTAKIFTDNIILELKELGFNNSLFQVNFNDIPTQNDCSFISKNGFDKIEFMFSANIGEPVKPLSLIISGGEVSRFMLAIKSQTAKYSEIKTFIFDEIDSGISGKIAKIVGEKFNTISRNTQIIAITHLPQIAVYGDKNYLIFKEVQNNKTFSEILKLDDDGKKNEIIRLIGGDINSDSANKLAEELIFEAKTKKMNN